MLAEAFPETVTPAALHLGRSLASTLKQSDLQVDFNRVKRLAQTHLKEQANKRSSNDKKDFEIMQFYKELCMQKDAY